MPPPPPSVFANYLQDTSGQAWSLGASAVGAYTTTPVAGVGSSFLLLTDTATGNVFKLTVLTTGALRIDPATGVGLPNIPVKTPLGTAMGIVVTNNRISTILLPTCRFSLWDAAVLLAARLCDSGMAFWSMAELFLYIQEALRTWNALTEVWIQEFAFTATRAGGAWYDLSTLANSPRFRTVQDSDLYSIMQYHLLEPATGAGIWTGTSQFALVDLQGALQRRRDEVIQASGCNVKNLPPVRSTPNTKRVIFADSTLEPRRIRFVPQTGTPVTLSREDTKAFDGFGTSPFGQLPSAWSVIAEPPLAMDVDTAPNVPGSYDVLSLQSGPQFAPPAQTLLGVPDDWSWVVKWGALADLLSRDSEATDRQRASYCLKRYNDGIKIMRQSNWLLSATVNGIPVDTPSVREMDGYSPEWQNTATAWPSVVTAGMDLVAPCPVAGSSPIGVSVVLVGNTPVPKLATDCVFVSFDTLDAILDYAQVLASFKMGGEEFLETKDLEQNFFMVAQATNSRLAKTGIFSDVLRVTGRRQDIAQPR